MKHDLATRAVAWAAAAALAACAAPQGTPPPRASKLGTIAIVATGTAPASGLRAFATSSASGAAKGAAAGAGVSGSAFGIAGAGATGVGSAFLSWLAPAVIVASAVGVGVVGALRAIPQEKAQAMEDRLRAALTNVAASEALAGRVAGLARRDTRLVQAAPADTTIEVAVPSIALHACTSDGEVGVTHGGCGGDRNDPGVQLVVEAQVRLLPAAGGPPLHVQTLAYASPRRSFSRWTPDALATELERAFDDLANRVADELLLAPFELRVGQACGLVPRQPAMSPVPLLETIARAALPGGAARCLHPALQFTPAESLQPTLRWDAFPRVPDPRVDGVRYDVRVWEADGCGRGRLALERTGLEQPQVRVDESLQPGARYFWTFRARFTLDSEATSTGWAFVDPLRCAPGDHTAWQYHRFVTP